MKGKNRLYKGSNNQEKARLKTIEVLRQTEQTEGVRKIIDFISHKEKGSLRYNALVEAYFQKHETMELKPDVSFSQEMARYLAAQSETLLQMQRRSAFANKIMN